MADTDDVFEQILTAHARTVVGASGCRRCRGGRRGFDAPRMRWSTGRPRYMTDPVALPGDHDTLPIVQCGDPVLRRAADPVEPSALHAPQLQHLIAQMRTTMELAPGVGLAAPQVGVSLQVAVLQDGPQQWGHLSDDDRADREREYLPFTVLVNPTMQQVDDDDRISFYEGVPQRARLDRGGRPSPGRPRRSAGPVRPTHRPRVLGMDGTHRPTRGRPPARPSLSGPGPAPITLHLRQLRQPMGWTTDPRRSGSPWVCAGLTWTAESVLEYIEAVLLSSWVVLLKTDARLSASRARIERC